MTMQSFIGAVSEVVTAAVGWIGEYIEVITAHPILLAGVVVTFVGLGVGLIKRLVSL